MPVDIPSFDWRSLTAAINQIPKAPSMLQDLIFKNRNSHAAEHIDVDVVIGGRKILPFVSNSAGGTVIDKLTGQMQSVKAPRIRPKKPFGATELLTQRGPGKQFYANGGGVNAERNRKIGEELADIRNRVDMTIEFMCAQALLGSYSVSNDGYDFSIDFNMPATHLPTLGAGLGWNEAGGDVLGDIDTWAQLISDATGMGPDIAICGKNVVAALRTNSDVQALLDNRRNDAGGFSWDTNSNYIGKLNGIDLYRYGNSYTDYADASQTFISDDAFILVSSMARFSVEFGMILDLDAGGAEIVGEYFSKSWLEKDPSVLWMLAESRPLPVLWQPEAVVNADVIV